MAYSSTADILQKIDFFMHKRNTYDFNRTNIKPIFRYTCPSHINQEYKKYTDCRIRYPELGYQNKYPEHVNETINKIKKAINEFNFGIFFSTVVTYGLFIFTNIYDCSNNVNLFWHKKAPNE